MPFKKSRRVDTRQSKEKRLGGALALSMIKQQNPGLYKRYKKAKDRYLELKKKIQQTRGRKGRQEARKKARR